jgi:hypothetical protein
LVPRDSMASAAVHDPTETPPGKFTVTHNAAFSQR